MLVLCGVMYMAWCCIRLKRTLSLFKQLTVIDCDELLENMLAEAPVSGANNRPSAGQTSEQHARKRARLVAVVSGGWKMMFKGQTVTPERIDAMEEASRTSHAL